MSANHALFFVFNGPREGKEAQFIETRNAMTAYWTKKKSAGDIASFENIILASSGNPNMPAGFTLVLGDRAKLHAIRWDDNDFLNLHTTAMVTTNGYACIDGYAGDELTKHVQRLMTINTKR
jgi:hypothetical protein